MVQSLPEKLTNLQLFNKFPPLYGTWRFKRPPPVPSPSQISPVHSSPSHFLKFHFSIQVKANLIGYNLRRNCLLKQIIEGKIKGEIEVTRRRGRRRRKLLDDLKDRRGYCNLKEEALDRTMWRNRFGGGFEPVVRQNTEWMNDITRIIVLIK